MSGTQPPAAPAAALVRFYCPACDKRFKTDPRHAGKRIGCPRCGALVLVPFPEGDERTQLIGDAEVKALASAMESAKGNAPEERIFPCPLCHRFMIDDGTLAGLPVICPHCREEFCMGGVPRPERADVSAAQADDPLLIRTDREARAKKRMDRKQVAILCVLGAFAFVVVGFGIVSAFWDPLLAVGIGEPPFELSRGTERRFGDYVWFTITNTSETPLTVTKVILNGEFQALNTDVNTGWMPRPDDLNPDGPVRLSIGEHAEFLEWRRDRKHSYEKTVIFVDVYTDRGDFRFDGGGTLIGRAP